MVMSFWTSYVLSAEKLGIERSVSLDKIEAKYGAAVRQQIEAELAAYDAANGGASNGGDTEQNNG